MEAQDNIRKRVCKACDRCRLKKSKVRATPDMRSKHPTNRISAMGPAPAVGVRLTTRFAFLESERSRKTRSTLKGML